ncbi:MAG: fatty acid desaturase [Pseudomonadales bacterium]|nr:fatty acid desaturase [Pseudomonadales bacterium]
MSQQNHVRALRDRIKSELPPDTFQAQPWRLIWFAPLLATLAVSWWVLATIELPWYASLGIALLIGNTFASMGFLSHEVSHGAMGVQGRLKTFFAGLGFAPFLVTADFWHRWHNVAHHGNTNVGDKDPDSFGTLKRYERTPAQKKLLKLAPGSGTWYSYLFLFYSFTLHSQVVLWLQTKHRKEFKGFKRKQAIAGMFLLLAGWIALGFILGLEAALYGIVLPHLIGNAVVQSYILTNHFLRPQTAINDPVNNSMSLKSLPLWDKLHFNFSHHVEHHLFPKLPMNKAPRLRKWFLENMPERYVFPTHSTAIKYLYKTPKVYADSLTLIDVNDPNFEVDLIKLNQQLNPLYKGPIELQQFEASTGNQVVLNT